VAEGTLKAGVAGTFSAASAHTVQSGATLDLNSFSTHLNNLTGAGTVAIGGGSLFLSGTSNFAGAANAPDQGIVYLENTGRLTFQPYEFTAAALNQWNLMAIADLDRDGLPDVLIGAMNLENVAGIQQGFGQRSAEQGAPLLVLENRLRRSPR